MPLDLRSAMAAVSPGALAAASSPKQPNQEFRMKPFAYQNGGATGVMPPTQKWAVEKLPCSKRKRRRKLRKSR